MVWVFCGVDVSEWCLGVGLGFELYGVVFRWLFVLVCGLVFFWGGWVVFVCVVCLVGGLGRVVRWCSFVYLLGLWVCFWWVLFWLC